jgi:type I restriction enzyme S subunit
LPIPGRVEQDEIVLETEHNTAAVDELSGRVRDAIDRLKELRTALISAAVTGKIDVRDHVALQACSAGQ